MDFIEHEATYAVSYVSLRFGNIKLSSCSGFLWRANEETYLITNWHNVTGRHSETGKLLSATGGIPDHLVFSVFLRRAPSAGGQVMRTPDVFSVPLYEVDGSPIWLEHPEHGSKVDVVAIPLVRFVANDLLDPLNEQKWLIDLEQPARVGDDAFVIGYPLGVIAHVPIPVWKRATVATEPGVAVSGLPKMFVDTATRKGMSGSPVVVRRMMLGPHRLADGSVESTLLAIRHSFLGVYSGRLDEEEIRAQIGIVWRRSVVEEIVAKAPVC